jgi:glycosyltransferase involved in cell wall biosynthesis
VVAAVSMVKDENDIVESTVRRMARHVDFLIVADNGSTDGTREILDRLALELPLEVVEDPEPGYFQSEKMTRLAIRAAGRGAEWVVPFDADEVWLPRTGGSIASLLRGLPANVLMAEAVLFDHVATGIDPPETDPLNRMGWRRAEAAPLRKVAVRPVAGLTIHQGNHGATFAGVRHPPAVTTALEVRHYPYRSVEQMISKARNGAAAYAATDLPDHVGAHWRGYGRLSDEELGDVFRRYFWRADPAQNLRLDGERQPPLVFDPAR